VRWSSWRVWSRVKPRRNVPTVDGAMTRWPSTLAVAPQPSHVHVVDAVPADQHAVDQVSSLAPGLAAPGLASGGRRRRPRRCRAARRGWQPAAARRWPRCGGRRSSHRGGQGWVAWDGGIERVTSLAATADVRHPSSHPYSRSSQGPFMSRSRHRDSLTGGSRLRPRAAVRPGAAWFTRRCWQIAWLRRPGFGPGSMRRRRDRAGLVCSPVGPRPR
jgi:hypothetical protein